MLGWSIHIKSGEETVLYAESTDLSLDGKIRENSEEELDCSGEFLFWSKGCGYPNRYHIRNDQLAGVEVYRHVKSPEGCHPPVIRETFNLGPIPDISGDTILFVEIWDQS